MSEKSLKHQIFWFVVSFAFVAGLSLGSFIGAIATKEHGTQPIMYRLEIEHVRPPLLPSALQGKRSEPGKLSPETEHRQAIDMIFRGERSPEMRRGSK